MLTRKHWLLFARGAKVDYYADDENGHKYEHQTHVVPKLFCTTLIENMVTQPDKDVIRIFSNLFFILFRFGGSDRHQNSFFIINNFHETCFCILRNVTNQDTEN